MFTLAGAPMQSHVRAVCDLVSATLGARLGKVLGAEQPHSAIWNIVGTRDVEHMGSPIIIFDAPNQCANHYVSEALATKTKHSPVGGPQGAWLEVSLSVTNAGRGSIVHANEFTVGVKLCEAGHLFFFMC